MVVRSTPATAASASVLLAKACDAVDSYLLASPGLHLTRYPLVDGSGIGGGGGGGDRRVGGRTTGSMAMVKVELLGVGEGVP